MEEVKHQALQKPPKPLHQDSDGSLSNQEEDEDMHQGGGGGGGGDGSDYNSDDDMPPARQNRLTPNAQNGLAKGQLDQQQQQQQQRDSLLAAAAALNFDAISNLKPDELSGSQAAAAAEVFARLKQHQAAAQHFQQQQQQQQHHRNQTGSGGAYDSGAEEEEEPEDEDMGEDDLKPEQRELMVAMQRHAAQMAAAASGLPNATHLANLVSLGGLAHLNPNAMCQLNSMLMAGGAGGNLGGANGGGVGGGGSNSSPSGSSGSATASCSPALQSIEAGKGYTYEEQFKQLYEINDDPKRKPFLDELFTFMQKRGTPINRIPIMAKQVLDLYELYQLVVARGGLVEVINKKIWREITKGLNLPSSITSAAFTLRTQYMKYLYPYECEKEKLSNPEELQMAIDGNRREGRRSSYGQYPELGGAGNSSPSQPSPQGNSNSAAAAAAAAAMLAGRNPFSFGAGNANGLHGSPLSLMARHLNGQGHSSGDEDNNSVSSNPPYPMLGQNEALNLEMNNTGSNASGHRHAESMGKHFDRKLQLEDMLSGCAPNKRFKSDENFLMNSPFPGTQMKISSKDGQQLDGQLTVSMEINGVLYHGILFAQTNRNNV